MVNAMNEWAVIEGGVVVNTILWDGESDWTPNENQIAVEIPDVPEGNQHAGIGRKYSDGTFIAPLSPEEITTQQEQ